MLLITRVSLQPDISKALHHRVRCPCIHCKALFIMQFCLSWWHDGFRTFKSSIVGVTSQQTTER